MDEPRKLLVLDLDETLVYATSSLLERAPDFSALRYSVYKRPYLAEFLRYCFAHFDVGVWTSSGSDYAAAIVRAIFPVESPLVFCWTGERGTRAFDPERCEYYAVKRFSKLYRRFRQYGRGGIIVVDDTAQKWEQSYGNLVSVREWLGEPDDTELLLLMRYLEVLREHPNVRTVEKRGWRSQIETAKPESNDDLR